MLVISAQGRENKAPKVGRQFRAGVEVEILEGVAREGLSDKVG